MFNDKLIKMSENNPYQGFGKYILRTPLLPFSFYKEFTSKKDLTDNDFKELYNNPIIKEALFLASPSFYEQTVRWINGEVTDEKKADKLKHSILKYVSRMSSRCTPFGLFAGCSVGQFQEKTNIKLTGGGKNERHTRLDMNYLVALSQNLAKNETIKQQLLFFPNSSIYKAGSHLRYVEYSYINSRRLHHIIGVDDTEYLNRVIEKASKGALLEDLIQELVDDCISIEEATSFVEELVSSQLLISELEPSVSGPEFLEQIYSVLKSLNGVDEILIVLDEAKQKIKTLDSLIGNEPQKYLELSTFLEKLKTEFNLKFMFQTDMVLKNEKNTLKKEVIDDVKKGLVLLNKIAIPPQETLLSKFKDAFYERFEEREVLLSKALDTEIGLGYKQGHGSGDINPLVDDLVISRPRNKNVPVDIKWSNVNALFQKKLIQAFKENAYTISLNNQDFIEYEGTWNDLPDTFSCMIEVLKIEGTEKIKFSGGGGSSASNLLGRFCHGDKELHQYTKEIIDVETKINSDKLLAEIVHLPESRVGNILMRPDFRKYEIPYLAKSIKDEGNQLPLDDLMISVKNYKRIALKSKKHNKEVVPHLTNAHNYSNNSLPIYHFLSDMQTQGIRSGIGFNLGPFTEEYEFIPRIEYHNLILQNATWNLKKKHLKSLIDSINDSEKFSDKIRILCTSLKIPQYVMLVDSDNELLINFENLTSVRMLIDTVRKRDQFKLTEFLFNDEGVVKKGDDYYTNQVIMSFYNEQKLKRA